MPVWVFAPTGRDAALLKSGLPRGDGLRVAQTTGDLARGLREDGEVGVLVMTQEALTPDTAALLAGFAEGQPPWAELPIVLLVDAAGNTMPALEALRDTIPRVRLLVLQRPVRLSELGTAVETMRQSRHRQHDLRDYVERQERLRRELNHRVKNILATVQALYGLTVRTSDDLDGFDAVFQPRLGAMARVHEVLFESNYGDVDLRRLVDAVLAPLAGDERLRVEGPAVTVPAEMGQSLSLVVHELATNAGRHGALTRDAGRVALSWTPDSSLELVWAERGGPAVEAPTRSGYGTAFVTATIRSLGGTAAFDYDPAGLRFAATLPLPGGHSETREGDAS